MKRILAVALLLGSALPALAKEVVPFIENDFSKAVSQAKAKKQPIFVDAWAPW
jgi:thioredoxin-like negative regulator of GroEL